MRKLGKAICSFLVVMQVALNPALAANSIEISADIPAQAKAENWLLLDVRSTEEYNEGHIPGAVNIPHDNIAAFADKLPDDTDRKIVVYCRSGRRAALAIESLSGQYQNLHHLNGDMLGWEALDLPVEKVDEPTQPVKQ